MKWYPTQIAYPFGTTIIELERYPESIFDYPFLEYGIRAYSKKNGAAEKSIMSIVQYKAYLEEQVIVGPTGFIFHPSRSGSTLIARMLAQLENCRVVSEPKTPIQFYMHSIINRKGDFDKEELRLIILGLLVRDQGQINKTFIKFSSWMIDLLPILRDVFPNTPCLYVYRSPKEILRSAINKPSLLITLNKRNPKVLVNQINGTLEEIKALSKETFLAKLTAFNFQSVINCHSIMKTLKIIEYKDIKRKFAEIIEHFRIQASSQEWEQIGHTSKYHSKELSPVIFKPEALHFEENTDLEMVLQNENLEDLYIDLNKIVSNFSDSPEN